MGIFRKTLPVFVNDRESGFDLLVRPWETGQRLEPLWGEATSVELLSGVVKDCLRLGMLAHYDRICFKYSSYSAKPGPVVLGSTPSQGVAPLLDLSTQYRLARLGSSRLGNESYRKLDGWVRRVVVSVYGIKQPDGILVERALVLSADGHRYGFHYG